MKIKVINTEGKETGKEVSLPKDIFGIEPNEHAIYLAVKQFRANQRQGTHKAKERSEVAGSRRKIKRQKGTGTARAGDIKNPLFRGGGRVFGPRPKDYGFKLNKKVKELAKKSALSQKAKANDIIIVDTVEMDEPKTKQFVDIIANMGLNEQKTCLVLSEDSKNVYLSSRNIQGCKLTKAVNLNIYEILDCQKLVLSEGALKVIQDQMA